MPLAKIDQQPQPGHSSWMLVAEIDQQPQPNHPSRMPLAEANHHLSRPSIRMPLAEANQTFIPVIHSDAIS